MSSHTWCSFRFQICLPSICVNVFYFNLFAQVLNVPEDIEIDRVLFKECPPFTWVTEVAILDPALDTKYNFSIIDSALPLQVRLFC